MSRYVISQKYFSMRDRFTITDETGRGCFQVEGKFFSIGKKFTLFNMQGQEIYFIKQRLCHWFATFDVMFGDTRVARIKRRPALFVKRMKIYTETQGVFKIKGNAFAWDFHIEQDGNQVANISKAVLHIADTYTLDVAPGQDDALMVAAAILVDCLWQKSH